MKAVACPPVLARIQDSSKTRDGRQPEVRKGKVSRRGHPVAPMRRPGRDHNTALFGRWVQPARDDVKRTRLVLALEQAEEVGDGDEDDRGEADEGAAADLQGDESGAVVRKDREQAELASEEDDGEAEER